MRRLGLLALFLCIISSASAQDEGFTHTTLEPINAQNASQVAQLWGEGIGYGGGIDWSADGQAAYFQSIGGIWEYQMDDLEHPKQIVELPFPVPDYNNEIPNPVATSPGGRYVVHQNVNIDNEHSAIYDVEDMSTGIVIKSIPGDAIVMRTYSGILFIPQFFDDGLLFLRGGALYRWNPVTDTEVLLVEQFIDLSISPNGHYAVTYAVYPSVNVAMELRVWDLATAPATQLYEHIFPAMDAWHSIAISPNGQQIATGGSNANIRFWDFSTNDVTYTETNRPDQYGEQEIVDLEYSADGRFLAGCVSSVSTGYAFIMDSQNGRILATIRGESGSGNSYFGGVAFNPGDQTVLFGGADGSIRAWSINTLIKLQDTTIDTAERIFTGHSKPVVGIAISPDGDQVATASWDNTIKLWDYPTGQIIQTLDFHTAPAWGVAFSPDGKALATSAEDGTVRIWDLETNQETILATVAGKREFQPSKTLITDLEFSPDGSILAGSEFNGQIHIWDMQQRLQVALLDANETTWHLAFNKAGTLLTTADTVGTVKLWGVD